MGTIVVEIYLDRVPVTVSNFVDLAQNGFYDGIHFHRVIAGFMCQFGCPHARDPNSSRAGTGGPPDGVFQNLVTGAQERRQGGCIRDENISRDSNQPGTLSMANTGEPNSGGSQFFINVADNSYLDWFTPGQSKHLVFGRVVDGYDVVLAICDVRVNSDDRPASPIVMRSITINHPAPPPPPPPAPIKRITNPIVLMDTSMGVMKAEIFLDCVPLTASNFIDLTRAGFYDGIHFHRVIDDFICQFGCPNARDHHSRRAGTGGPPDGVFQNLITGRQERRTAGCIEDEFISRDSNQVGTLSMANTGGPNSGGSQFFINMKDNSPLDWFTPGPSRHPVFGAIVEGYDIAVDISKAATDNADKPIQPIQMRRMLVMHENAAGPFPRHAPQKGRPQQARQPPPPQQMPNPIVVMETTMGVMEAELFLDRVPVTVSNFIDLVQSGFYNGLHFHRVMENFMNQVGCPFSMDPHSRHAGTGGPPNGTFRNLLTGGTEQRFNKGNITDEHTSRDSNEKGTLSMANIGQPHTGGSQFFINVSHNDFLDWFSPGESKHPVFGKLVSDYDVAVAISKAPTHNDRPIQPIQMRQMRIVANSSQPGAHWQQQPRSQNPPDTRHCRGGLFV